MIIMSIKEFSVKPKGLGGTHSIVVVWEELSKGNLHRTSCFNKVDS